MQWNASRNGKPRGRTVERFGIRYGTSVSVWMCSEVNQGYVSTSSPPYSERSYPRVLYILFTTGAMPSDCGRSRVRQSSHAAWTWRSASYVPKAAPRRARSSVNRGRSVKKRTRRGGGCEPGRAPRLRWPRPLLRDPAVSSRFPPGPLCMSVGRQSSPSPTCGSGSPHAHIRSMITCSCVCHRVRAR